MILTLTPLEIPDNFFELHIFFLTYDQYFAFSCNNVFKRYKLKGTACLIDIF